MGCLARVTGGKANYFYRGRWGRWVNMEVAGDRIFLLVASTFITKWEENV